MREVSHQSDRKRVELKREKAVLQRKLQAVTAAAATSERNCEDLKKRVKDLTQELMVYKEVLKYYAAIKNFPYSHKEGKSCANECKTDPCECGTDCKCKPSDCSCTTCKVMTVCTCPGGCKCGKGCTSGDICKCDDSCKCK